MRVSTQMFYENTKKAGISVDFSLLEHINNKDKEVIPNKNEYNAGNNYQSKYFDKVEESSEKLLNYLSKLTAEDKESIWDKAQEIKDNKEITNAVENMIKSYNDMYKNMQNAGGSLNEFYSYEVQNMLKEHAGALKELGISSGKDGSLTIDNEKFSKTDLEAIKKMFGKDSAFSKKLAIITSKVEENAIVSKQSLSNQYTANGYGTNSIYNKHDFWA